MSRNKLRVQSHHQFQIDEILNTIKQVQSEKQTRSSLWQFDLKFEQDNVIDNQQETDAQSQRFASSGRIRFKYQSPTTSRSNLYSRKTDTTPLTIRSMLNIPFIHDHEKQYVEKINQNDLTGCYLVISNMMLVAVEQDNFFLMAALFQVYSLTFIYFKEYAKALLYLNHCKSMGKYLRKYDLILWSFQQMGLICKYTQKYENGLTFVKKALEFAWFINDVDQELICYEQMGLLCFLNCDLVNAKALHDKSIGGNYEPPNSLMRQISSKGFQKIIKMMPEQIDKINQNLIAKAVNYPFRLINCYDPNYYHYKKVKNQYLIRNHLECVSEKRILDADINLDEQIKEILKSDMFFFEIPIPVSTNFKDESNDQETEKVTPLKRVQRMKELELMTLVKLATYKDVNFTKTQQQPPVYKLDQNSKKLPLAIFIQERLKQKYEEPSLETQRARVRKLNNLQSIRITHEQNKKNILSLEHTKKGLIKTVQQILKSTKPKQNFNFSDNFS